MKRKCALAAGIIMLLIAVEGCGNGQEAGDKNVSAPMEETADEDEELQGQNVGGEGDASPTPALGDEGDDMANQPAADIEEDMQGDAAPGVGTDDSGAVQGFSQETMLIGGRVRDIMEDSFVISRVQYADDDSSMVLIPEEGSPEEELVTVRCTESTTFEHWLIQGGGAGIDMSEAAFTDIVKGGGLEAEGYFDGEEFVAERVIIETYE